MRHLTKSVGEFLTNNRDNIDLFIYFYNISALLLFSFSHTVCYVAWLIVLLSPFSRSRERSLFAFHGRCKTMEVKIEQQDEDITFSNTDTNSKILHVFIIRRTHPFMTIM